MGLLCFVSKNIKNEAFFNFWGIRNVNTEFPYILAIFCFRKSLILHENESSCSRHQHFVPNMTKMNSVFYILRTFSMLVQEVQTS